MAMMCRKPYHNGSSEFGCGQCQPCRINRLRVWTCRLMLEAREHPESSFLTLTYAQEKLPVGGVLVKKDLQKFFKRLRKNVGNMKLRYYAVGEYGENTLRPHYHALVFGLPLCYSEMVQKSWNCGLTKVGTVTQASISYVVGYLMKKQTNVKGSPLEGYPPEFAIMSTKPGLGYGLVKRVEEAYMRYGGQKVVHGEDRPPTTIRLEGSKYHVGSYLQKAIYARAGYSDDDIVRWSREDENKKVEEAFVMSPDKLYQDRLVKTDRQLSRRLKRRVSI